MPDVTRRHVLAGLLGLLGAGAAGAYVQSGDGDGQAALGGATPEQDVGVIDLLVVLGDETYEFDSPDQEVYHGRELREGAELVLEPGDGYILKEVPQ